MKLFLTFILLIDILRGNPQGAVSPGDKYDRKEAMIPTRDGTKLHTVIFTPKGQKEALPFLLMRTPYGASNYWSPERVLYIKDMAEEGYIFVLQDIRGRYQSEGQYVMSRPLRDK